MVFWPGCLQCIGVGACLDGAVPRWAGYATTTGAYRTPNARSGSTDGTSGTHGFTYGRATSTSKTPASPGEQVLGHLHKITKYILLIKFTPTHTRCRRPKSKR